MTPERFAAQVVVAALDVPIRTLQNGCRTLEILMAGTLAAALVVLIWG